MIKDKKDIPDYFSYTQDPKAVDPHYIDNQKIFKYFVISIKELKQ